MILHAQAVTAAGHGPWLVWLHGFLGNHREWMPIAEPLSGFSQLFIDLPGHGQSAQIEVTNFAEVDALLRATLAYYQVPAYWLVGYSMGGRVAMYHACQPAPALRGLIVEAGHPGLSADDQRQARFHHDKQWAQRLCNEPLVQVLADWYQQPIFADIDASLVAQWLHLRADNDPYALARALQAISLGNQPDLRVSLAQLAIPFYYFCGEHDHKYRALAADLSARLSIIAGAGHNAHAQCPTLFSQRIQTLLSDLT